MVVVLKNVLSTRAMYCITVGRVLAPQKDADRWERARAPALERKVGIVGRRANPSQRRERPLTSVATAGTLPSLLPSSSL